MMPGQMGLQPQAGSSETHDSEQSRKKYKKGDDALLTRAATCLWELPKIRLKYLITRCHPDYDVMALRNLDTEQLAMLLYVLTGVNSDMRVADCAVNSYEELGDQMVKTKDRRVWEESARGFTSVIHNLGSLPLNPAHVEQYAMQMGFDMQWLVPQKKSKKAKAQPPLPMIADLPVTPPAASAPAASAPHSPPVVKAPAASAPRTLAEVLSAKAPLPRARPLPFVRAVAPDAEVPTPAELPVLEVKNAKPCLQRVAPRVASWVA